MCSDCPKNCPVDNENSHREHTADWHSGRQSAENEIKDILIKANKEMWPSSKVETAIWNWATKREENHETTK